jgi:MtfA peptidase
MTSWWSRWQQGRAERRIARVVARRHVDDALWQQSANALPFVRTLPAHDLTRLRVMVSLFLDSKEFSGAQGFVASDAQAVMVAVQACIPLLHIDDPKRPDKALAWYDSFVGIVLHASEVRAQREHTDEHGIAHAWREPLSGETLDGGPLMLAWSDVALAGETAHEGYNVVIHEFVHVMDLRDGTPDGCPPMPSAQRRLWLDTLHAEYERYRTQLDSWERFGGVDGTTEPLLDNYAATAIDEFFAVAAEAYFVRREDFAAHHPALLQCFDGFFRPRRSAPGHDG